MVKRTFYIGALCDIGSVKKTNQDGILVKIGENYYGEFGLFVIADGMGGLVHGDVASQIIINQFKRWWHEKLAFILNSSSKFDLYSVGNELDILIQDINKRVYYYSESIGSKVGSTLSMLLIYNDRYIIKHIGDSRIYMVNDNNIIQITEDHSWVAQQVRDGAMTLEQARNHSRRNVLTKCIGVVEQVDLFEMAGAIKSNESFLLCSDGLYNFVNEQEVFSVIGQRGRYKDTNLQDIAAGLLAKVKERGAADNISVIIVGQGYQSNNSIFAKLKNILTK